MNFVYVRQPATEEELREYARKIGTLGSDEKYMFFLSKLQHETMANFSVDKDNAEFYRGQMHLIGRILDQSREARKAIDGDEIQFS